MVEQIAIEINDDVSPNDMNEEDHSIKRQSSVDIASDRSDIPMTHLQEHSPPSICELARSERVDKQKQCVSKWSYDALRHTINTSQDVELIEKCRNEFLRRMKVYEAWKAEKAHKKQATLEQESAPQPIKEVVKSMDADSQSYPTTAPPPYPGPPENSSQPFVSGNNGPYSTYSTYPNQSAVTVVHGTPVVSGVRHIVIANNMSPSPAAYTCPSCNLQIVTRTERKSTLRTHICAAFLCLVACWPCVIIPYCMDSCNNIDHYCPNCSAYIGSYVG